MLRVTVTAAISSHLATAALNCPSTLHPPQVLDIGMNVFSMPATGAGHAHEYSLCARHR